MGQNFFLHFIRTKIEANMESDEDRRKKWEENLRREEAKAKSSYVRSCYVCFHGWRHVRWAHIMQVPDKHI